MSGIYGALGLNDTDRVFLSTLGQRVVYDAVNQVLAQHSADLNAAMGVFVEETTSDYKRRYKLAGGGRLQRMGDQSRPAAVKAYGSWDVAFPLEDFGAALSASDVAYAYMSVQDLDRHMNTILQQNVNSVRFEMLNALLGSAQGTFVDPLWGSLSIEPLANGDAVVYPPVLGSEDEATDNHYLESGYLASAISDTNNPFVTIRDELEEHFGVETGGSNIVVFRNNAQNAKVQALTDYDEVVDRFVRAGQDTDVPVGLPMTLPGVIKGRVSGCWDVEWRWVPANYMIAVHLDAPRPLIRRIDPADTGLGDGLQLVSTSDKFPFTESFYRHRFGVGCGNRLNGVVMELGNGGTYTVPTGYL